jgi:hypothetical protein
MLSNVKAPPRRGNGVKQKSPRVATRRLRLERLPQSLIPLSAISFARPTSLRNSARCPPGS